MRKLQCSVGICVYNEEKNIQKLLQSLLAQQLKTVVVKEIIIIISGSTDKTYQLVKQVARTKKNIKIIRQKRREGKASAVNIFIKNALCDVVVLMGGDLLLHKNTLEKLVSPFKNEEVGMTGARPIPLNKSDETICGFAAHLLWELHHRLSLERPKMGEVISFRRIFKRIPIISSVDEANIEPLIRGQGYLIRYIPNAVVYNKAPTTIADFIKQRRRIFCGHLAVKNEQSYMVSTMSGVKVLHLVYEFLKDNPSPKYFVFTPAVISLEIWSRFLGWWDYKIAKKRHTIWEMVESTKEL